MELPQPRPFGTESRKPTHDFLSLYSPVQQDPRPPSQGGYLKTHDFLQPLEQVEKNVAKEKNKVVITDVGKPPPASMEHILPGGIGTYSISHISNYINQKVPKPEGGMFSVAQASSSERNDEHSNCSSHTGSGFTLWEESAAKKGKTGKENILEDNSNVIRDATGVTIGGRGQWPPSLDRPSVSSSNHSPPIILRPISSAQKNQSFIDMIKSAAKTAQDADDYYDDDEDFVVKKEPSSSSHSHLNGNLSVKVDGKSTDQKPNTPRSKHSATEQRRRSKINDRFHMLRGLIPHGDQKRDKASFLLEVIEYIQFLQEKVHKYENLYPGWNEPPKLMSWGKNLGMPEDFVDLSRVTNCGPAPAVMFAAKFDENKISVSPTIPRNGHNLVESGMNCPDSFKEMDKASPIPVLLQPKIFSAGGSSSAAVAAPPRLGSDTENKASQPQSQPWQSRPCTTECTAAGDAHKDEALTIESGTISISSVYSQGLLNTLTQALQSSGVDLSQATISVQIDLGKQANSTLNSSTSILKDDVPLSNQTMAHSRLASTGAESDQALKRQKTGRTSAST